MRVAIVVLNWNGAQDTLRCLQSLSTLIYPASHTIVVDNGSTDDSLSQLRRSNYPVRLVTLQDNRGFSAGMNAGIRAALELGTDCVWLLNNDTIVTRSSLGEMVKTASDDDSIGAVGSVIRPLEASGSQEEAVQAWGGGRIHDWLGYSRHVENEGPIDYLMGASLLLRREAIESVGLLDETFFLYWEDADYSYRLLRARWRLAVSSSAIVYHVGSSSLGFLSPSSIEHFNRSAVKFFFKHSLHPAFPILFGTALRGGKRLLNADVVGMSATIRGSLHGLKDQLWR